MQIVKIETHLTADTEAAMRDAAAADGITIAELLDIALEREIQRREKRRLALLRNQIAARFDPLKASLG